mmetsp:Transcript_40364/g.67325  ORF Transcript_40364/g.67325 Transcript_40364/m.67325 type:complete len:227 (+) Transcript_40364:1997-2677(+)
MHPQGPVGQPDRRAADVHGEGGELLVLLEAPDRARHELRADGAALPPPDVRREDGRGREGERLVRVRGPGDGVQADPRAVRGDVVARDVGRARGGAHALLQRHDACADARGEQKPLQPRHVWRPPRPSGGALGVGRSGVRREVRRRGSGPCSWFTSGRPMGARRVDCPGARPAARDGAVWRTASRVRCTRATPGRAADVQCRWTGRNQQSGGTQRGHKYDASAEDQ